MSSEKTQPDGNQPDANKRRAVRFAIVAGVGAFIYAFAAAPTAMKTAVPPKQDARDRCAVRMQRQYNDPNASFVESDVTKGKRREFTVEGKATIDGRPHAFRCIYKGSERRVRYFAAEADE